MSNTEPRNWFEPLLVTPKSATRSAAILGLVGVDDDLYFGDGIRVDLQTLLIATRVDRRDAVEQVVRAGAVSARGARAGRHDTGGQAGKRGEVPAGHRQVLDTLGRDHERALARSAVWISGASVETLTVSGNVPCSMVMVPTETRSPGVTPTPLRSEVLNPLH